MSTGPSTARMKSLVRATPNWPRAGVTFLDVSPLLRDHDSLQACIRALAERYRGRISHVAGIDARGFTLGCARTLAYFMITVRNALRHLLLLYAYMTNTSSYFNACVLTGLRLCSSGFCSQRWLCKFKTSLRICLRLNADC